MSESIKRRSSKWDLKPGKDAESAASDENYDLKSPKTEHNHTNRRHRSRSRSRSISRSRSRSRSRSSESVRDQEFGPSSRPSKLTTQDFRRDTLPRHNMDQGQPYVQKSMLPYSAHEREESHGILGHMPYYSRPNDRSTRESDCIVINTSASNVSDERESFSLPMGQEKSQFRSIVDQSQPRMPFMRPHQQGLVNPRPFNGPAPFISPMRAPHVPSQSQVRFQYQIPPAPFAHFPPSNVRGQGQPTALPSQMVTGLTQVNPAGPFIAGQPQLQFPLVGQGTSNTTLNAYDQSQPIVSPGALMVNGSTKVNSTGPLIMDKQQFQIPLAGQGSLNAQGQSQLGVLPSPQKVNDLTKVNPSGPLITGQPQPPISLLGQAQFMSTSNLQGQSQPTISPSPQTINGLTQVGSSGLLKMGQRQFQTPLVGPAQHVAASQPSVSVTTLEKNQNLGHLGRVDVEKKAQIPSLQSSLSSIFGNGQHLPQLYAALNPTVSGNDKKDDHPSNPNSQNPSPPSPVKESVTETGPTKREKTKEVKGLKAFKCALVEFVKEALRPTWKEGQMSKEAHKTIVKKTVEKVVTTLEGNIPHTKERIDLYMDFAKERLTKLVQAYVEKYKKPE